MSVPPYLVEDLLTEILVRLPAKSIGRFRTVCKAWYRITTDPGFISDHAGRRPLKKLLFAYLETVIHPIHGNKARRLRRPSYIHTHDRLTRPELAASCNGVLLVMIDDGRFIVCNPVTRQLTKLPRMHFNVHIQNERAFYYHQPSGEYRVLYVCVMGTGVTYHILSTGSARPRHMDMRLVNAGEAGRNPLSRVSCTMPVPLHGRLHWSPDEYQDLREILAFDVVSETFHHVAAVPRRTFDCMELVIMDGMLVALQFGRPHTDLWVLEDYDKGRWIHQHRFADAWNLDAEKGRFSYLPSVLSVIAVGNNEVEITLYVQRGLMVYNTRTRKTVWTIMLGTSVKDMMVSIFLFRESLAQYACFHAPPPVIGSSSVRFSLDRVTKAAQGRKSAKWEFLCAVGDLVMSTISCV